tara:strand:- start:82 stop:492 length:411 start_codon:yes stop_codon:yes gene_type:complete
MNPFSFLNNFIKERPFTPKVYGASDMMSGKRNARGFNETLPGQLPNIGYSYRNEMNPGTYTPLIPNQNYGHGPAMNPYHPYINNYDRGLQLQGAPIPQFIDPSVVPMPYFRNDPGARLGGPDPIGSFEPYNKRGSA